MDRLEAFKIINNEREYQESIGCPPVSLEGELLLLGDYIDRARRAYAENFGDETETAARDVVRKIAAIAVRCMENHGAPARGVPQLKGERISLDGPNPMRHPSSIPDD